MDRKRGEIGVIAGAVCALAVSLKYRFGFDDSLDVVGVHLVGGLVGTLLIGFFLAYPTRSRRLPLCLAAATAVIVGVLGPLSGGATNPARQFGPALLSGTYGSFAVYLIAPVVGAALGAGIHRLLQRYGPARRVPTYRLSADTTDRDAV